MNRRRLKPLVLPLALLVAGGIAALVAEASVQSEATASAYGLIKVVSDLTLVISGGWLVVALARVLSVRPKR